jgi:hypothetical protein
VAAGAALEIDLAGSIKLGLGEVRITRFGARLFNRLFAEDVEAGLIFAARRGLVFLDISRRGLRR